MPAIEINGISKSFGAVRALRDVSLSVERREIRAIVGANGSGKSTLVKILAGFYRPDGGGDIRVLEEDLALPVHGGELRRLGVGFCHQNVPLAPGMSVLDNLLVGQYRRRGAQIRWHEEAERANHALSLLGIQLDLKQLVSRLTLQERAIIGIARSLISPIWGQTRVVIMDEPTAALSRGESSQVLDVIERAAKVFDAAVLLVDHRLDEVLRVADSVTVLRDGSVVGTYPTDDLSEALLAEKMVGRKLEQYYPSHEREGRGKVPSAVVNVQLPGEEPVTAQFTVGRGEILGVSGLPGSGYDKLPYIVFGADERSQGTVVIDGTVLDMARATIARCRGAGLVFVPEDRARQASAPGLSVRENVTILSGRSFRRYGFWSLRRERAFAEEVARKYGVVPVQVDLRFDALSGGNQQKALVGSALERSPRILILHEPTEGVDIASRRQLLELVGKEADHGASSLVSSVEVEELAELCDRVLVFRNGEIRSELEGAGLTAGRILSESF